MGTVPIMPSPNSPVEMTSSCCAGRNNITTEDKADKADNQPGEPRIKPHFQLNFSALRQQNFTHPQLRNRNHQIDQQRDGAGTVDKKFKHFCRGVIIDDNG